ncbi:hypothetical protein PENTCL1PPCAC_29675, partial [Pristionchus entomophagus]
FPTPDFACLFSRFVASRLGMDNTATKKCQPQPIRDENMDEEISFLDALNMSKEEALKSMGDDNKSKPAKATTKKSV